MNYLWIAIGSGVGGAARFACVNVMGALFGYQFAWGTLFVNVLGSFIIGMVAMWPESAKPMLQLEMRQFLMVGICGGYTTFSAFSLYTYELLRAGKFMEMGANIVLSVVLCVVAVWAGAIVGKGF